MMTDEQQKKPASASETIPDIFARYLKATSDEERQAIVQAHPPLFAGPVIPALQEARRHFSDTLREVKEACRMIDAVSGSLEYTGTPVELQPREAQLLLDEDTLLHSFSTSLASLLDAREKQGTVLPSVAAEATMSGTTAGSSAPASSCAWGAASGLWFTQPAIVLEVLSFLPTEVVLVEAENVCRRWRTWLFEPDVSRFFWVGCVQREFPRQLALLLQTEGEDLFRSDWRSLAMLCVAEEEDKGGETRPAAELEA
ncbi:hypothetical protein ABB37_03549 [Leptomonas pyrrhocoris]|uniref:F-box domain-containing protein n=1 Tax=Leptomonas pyrrhocoris TaxID=157538 RepID=A0A0N0DX23_LEPPY|nr:hypothetical protein ABB37_03549 [Leptomonas pyrrhocoris]KPA82495.1 hypothetical protein ABB37_03549 [Leptomonas pyrrhocoris]|eukprot:XP_015660934.1 hypothetical protein ABB37_03549 [Leptomonas pyrrhocoris]